MQMTNKMLKESIYKPIRNKPSHHCDKYTEKIVDEKRNEPIKWLGFQQGCFLSANKLSAVFETHTCVLYLQGSDPLRVSAGPSNLETPAHHPVLGCDRSNPQWDLERISQIQGNGGFLEAGVAWGSKVESWVRW